MANKNRYHRQKTVYLTDAEYKKITARLSGSGVSFSAFCRSLLASKRLIDKRSIPVDQFRELSAIGNNLNQLARVANQSRQIPAGFTSLLTQLKGHLQSIQEALE